MIIRSQLTRLICALVITLPLFWQSTSAADDIVWRPVTPEEMAMKTAKVEPGADAEAIFWEVRLDDKNRSKLSYSHYVRVKIFTERGRERFSKMDIPFMKNKKVENVAARVIKVDGTIVPLNPNDIFEREIAKAGKAKMLAKSFAVPGIEPGVIVEYQYTETIKGDSASGERLHFQRDIPMQKVTYYVRPYENTTLQFRSFNMEDTRFLKDSKGYSVANMYDVPALKEEPYMPPDDEVRRWVYLRYSNILQALFQWSFVSDGYAELLKKSSKPNKEVKAKAAELTAGIISDEEKLRKIYDFVQRDIKNLAFDKSLDEDQIKKLNIKDGDDALKKGMGGSFAIDMLFASLSRAAGFETNVILSGDRTDNFFTPQKYPYREFISLSGVAVKVGKDWRYFDPCTPYHSFGRLDWYRENSVAMIIGDGGYVWKTIPVADHKMSPSKRSAKLTLAENGELEGSVTMAYDGHQAMGRRRDGFLDSESKRETDFKDEIKSRISTAEISDLRIENFDDNTKPLTYSFKIKVPNYAQRAGKRLILQPGLFEYGSNPVFSSDTREHDIHFPYPWSEADDISIVLPKSFALDSPDSPPDLADPKEIGKLQIVMKIDRSSNTLLYTRRFHFGGGGSTLFPVAAYTPIKRLFDAFNKSDTHAITLIQAAQ